MRFLLHPLCMRRRGHGEGRLSPAGSLTAGGGLATPGRLVSEPVGEDTGERVGVHNSSPRDWERLLSRARGREGGERPGAAC